MNITITIEEAMDVGIWDEICELKGINPYCLNEGRAQPEDTITLTMEEGRKLGLVAPGPEAFLARW